MVNEPGRPKSGYGQNSWLWGKHPWLCSDLLQALKEKHLSVEGTVISASTVPLCRSDSWPQNDYNYMGWVGDLVLCYTVVWYFLSTAMRHLWQASVKFSCHSA